MSQLTLSYLLIFIRVSAKSLECFVSKIILCLLFKQPILWVHDLCKKSRLFLKSSRYEAPLIIVIIRKMLSVTAKHNVITLSDANCSTVRAA